LGRILVVDDLDVAVALAKRCDNGVRLVTLDGELVLPAGAITGGQGKGKASGLLARKRELDELEARVETLHNELKTRDEALNAARSAIDVAQSALRAAQEKANDLRSQIARQEREDEHGEREARRVGKNREATESQIAQMRAQLQSRGGAQTASEQEAERLGRRSPRLGCRCSRSATHRDAAPGRARRSDEQRRRCAR
jgi:chromosome segregation protein